MSNSCDQILHEKPKAKNIIAGDINQSNIGECSTSLYATTG